MFFFGLIFYDFFSFFRRQSVTSPHGEILLDVKSSLDRESRELDRILETMNDGQKLLRQKELKIKQLEMSMASDEVSRMDCAKGCCLSSQRFVGSISVVLTQSANAPFG